MSQEVIEKSFCTTREAAVLLGVSVGTVQLWVESGLLRAWKTAGGHRRVLRDSVDRLLRKVPDQIATNTDGEMISLGGGSLNVMAVDDDQDLLRLYKTKLTQWPMHPTVTCVDSAVSALMTLGRGGQDMLIVDLHMPEMDGFAMLRILRKATEMENTTIVVVTGLDKEAIAKRGGLPDGIEVLGKPIPFDRLLEIATDTVRTMSTKFSAF
jgi:excisionase family DNA binding protein